MERKKDVYIVILNYNNEDLTIMCIRSLQMCTYPHKQIIVVDNGSGRESVEAIRRAYPFIKILENPENLGFTGGNNVGLRCALEHGPGYILFLNNDTEVDSGFLEPLIEALDSDDAIGVVCPAIYYFDTPEEPWYLGGKVNRFTGFPSMTIDMPSTDINYAVQFITGCAFMAKSELFMKLGFFDEDYFLYGDDVDFSMKVINRGYNVLVAPKSKVYHKVNRTIQTDSYTYIYYTTKSTLIFQLKNNRGWRKFLFLCTSTIFLVARGIKRSAGYILRDTRRSMIVLVAMLHGIVDGWLRKTGKVSKEFLI